MGHRGRRAFSPYLLSFKPCELCVISLSPSFCDEVFSLDAAHLKDILALSFKNSNNNVVHVASAIFPKENADAYTYLPTNAMKFESMKKC